MIWPPPPGTPIRAHRIATNPHGGDNMLRDGPIVGVVAGPYSRNNDKLVDVHWLDAASQEQEYMIDSGDEIEVIDVSEIPDEFWAQIASEALT